MQNKKIFPLLYSSLLAFVVFFFGKQWGYDEFGVLLTQVELNNKYFIEFYTSFLNQLFHDQFITKTILESLPLFITPLRWTYAIGISPIYSLMYFYPLDWKIASKLFLLIHIFIAGIGLHLIAKNIGSKEKNYGILLILLSLILLSKNFNYWVLTLTHYSFNLICFGLLAVIYANNNYSSSTKVFSVKSFSLLGVSMLNYFYVPILVTIAVLEIINLRLKFFYNGNYKSWILPAIGSLVGLCFILIRSNFLNEFGLWSQDIYLEYLVYENMFSETLINFSERLLQIFSYFYLDNDYSQSFIYQRSFDINILQAFLIIFSVMALVILGFKFSPNKNIAYLCLVIISVVFIEYIFTVIPMIPSRHSLILFIPMSYFISVLAVELLSYLKNQLIINSSLIGLFGMALILFFDDLNRQNKSNKNVDIYTINSCLNDKVDQVILDQCYLYPTMYNSFREGYDPVYSCGSRVIQKISDDSKKIAFISNTMSLKDEMYIKQFINKEDMLVLNNNYKCEIENIDISFYSIKNENK